MRDVRQTALLPLTENPDVTEALNRIATLSRQNGTETWNIMVYMAGDNNLAEDMVRAMKAMFRVGSQPHCRLFAYYDAGLRPFAFKIPTREEREALREALQPNRARRASAEPIAETEGFLSMMGAENFGEGDILSAQESLERFVKCAICDSPADRYMLVLSGHGDGAGTGGDFLAARKRANGLTISTLRATLANLQRFFSDNTDAGSPPLYRGLDILGLDSCHMSTIETAYEIRGHAQFVVGAEGYEPNTGWPYDQIVERLTLESLEHGALGPKTVAECIVEEYTVFYATDYSIAEVSTDQSAVDVDEVRKLTQTLKGRDSLPGLLIRALGASYDDAVRASDERALGRLTFNGPELDAEIKNAMVLARWESQGYKDERNVDFSDFCRNLKRRCEEMGALRSGSLRAAIANACDRVGAAIDGEGESSANKAVVLSGYCGPAFQHSHGLSIFFPWSRATDAAGVADLSQYRMLDFGFDTDWPRFLEIYTRTTQRNCRETSGAEHQSTLNRCDWLYPSEPLAPISDEAGEPIQFTLVIDPDARHDDANGSGFTIGDAVLTVGDGKISVRGGPENLGVRDGKITVRDGKITVRDGKITVRDGKITVRDGKITVRDGKITVRDGSSYDLRDTKIASRDGKITVRDGKITVRDGKITVRGADHNVVGGNFDVRDGKITVRDGKLTVRGGTHQDVRGGLCAVRDGKITVRSSDGAAARADWPLFARGGGASGGITKIASMKNPPVRWKDCDLMAKSNRR